MTCGLVRAGRDGEASDSGTTILSITQISPNSSITAMGIMTKPAKSWKNFCATSSLTCITSRAVTKIRTILQTTATGMLDTNRTPFCHRGRFTIYAMNAATMMNAISMRSPLQASATSSDAPPCNANDISVPNHRDSECLQKEHGPGCRHALQWPADRIVNGPRQRNHENEKQQNPQDPPKHLPPRHHEHQPHHGQYQSVVPRRWPHGQESVGPAHLRQYEQCHASCPERGQRRLPDRLSLTPEKEDATSGTSFPAE